MEPIVIETSIKQGLKTERLNQYKSRMFNVQMDIEAYKATADSGRQQLAEKQLADLEKAYWAVDAMSVE